MTIEVPLMPDETASRPSATTLLAGVRIVDVSMLGPGALTTRLADLGADGCARPARSAGPERGAGLNAGRASRGRRRAFRGARDSLMIFYTI
ncbi:hypothetical protein [Pseudofrankia sp. DC12]|uniref:hypothetical protein n=1 Tax=Pseudofrankia sp. DC12 TaxID=683315 RepID=UPI0005F7A420|nr:hypothetical protein [Pseudofrankia sp. DC12]